MSVDLPSVRISQFETKSILRKGTYEAGTYLVKMNIEGTSLLSSAVFLSGSGTVKINYYNLTVFDIGQERTDISSHRMLTAPNTRADTIMLSNIHERLHAEIIITGGPVELGLTGTMIEQPIPNAEIGFKPEFRDPFNRPYFIQPIEIGSTDHRLGKLPREWDEVVVGGATSVANLQAVAIELTTGTGATDRVTRQTYRQFEYIRGNAQFCIISCNPGGGAKANNERLWGMGDERNGVFFGVDANGFKVLRRSYISGVAVDFPVYQEDFNGDKLDGTGASGITIDLTKHQLFKIQFSWLGTNVIQFRYLIDGRQIIVHTINTANQIETPWSQSGSYPLHVQNRNIGIAPSSTTFKISCSAVFTAGSSKEISTYGAISTGTQTVSVNTQPSVVAGIRLRPDRRYIGLNAESYDLLPISGTGVAYYQIILRPTLTGAVWQDYSEAAQILTNTPTYVPGTGQIIQVGYANLAVQGRNAVEIPARINATLGYSISQNPDSIIILAQTTVGNGSLYFAGSWREII